MDKIKDYYRILQVDRFAETEVIQAAYKRLAKKYHPDVNPSPDATRVMKELNEAFEVLGDPQKRSSYDSQLRRKSNDLSGGGRRYQKDRDTVTEEFPDPIESITNYLPPDLGIELARRGEVVVQRSGQSSDNRCLCSQCEYVWTSKKRDSVPARCPRCRSDQWNKYRVLQCRHCKARFISGNYATAPYDLFPNCPHCRASNWHAEKEAQMEALRRREEARRRAEQAEARKRWLEAEVRREQELIQLAARIQRVSVPIKPITIVVFSITFILVASGVLKLCVSIYSLTGYLLIILAVLLLSAFVVINFFFESREKRTSEIIVRRLDKLVAEDKIIHDERIRIEQYIKELENFESREKSAPAIIARRLDKLAADRKITPQERIQVEQYIRLVAQ
jgi:curved DNA-binding protein CbpA